MNCIKHFDTSRRIATTPAITVRPLSENIASPGSKRSERRSSQSHVNSQIHTLPRLWLVARGCDDEILPRYKARAWSYNVSK